MANASKSKHGLCLGGHGIQGLNLVASWPSIFLESAPCFSPKPPTDTLTHDSFSPLLQTMTKGKNERNLLSWNTLAVRYDLTIIRHALIVVLLWLLSGGAAADDNTPPPSDPYGFNGKFNPSMAIIIVVLISAFFFMGFFSIYIRQCAGESETVRLPNGQGGGGRSRRATRGLDPAVIETFPTFVYSVVKGLKLGKGTLECAVCLSEFQDDETLRLLPKCDHVFHPDCIDAWLSSHTTCPVCRANLVPDPAAVVAEPADIEAGPEEENHATSDAVEIPIEEERNQDPPILVKVSSCRVPPELIQNRPPRTRSSRWSRFTGRFPRSHSTGHSLVQGDNYERYTLRLPENVRKQIVRAKLNRTISCVAYPNEGGSVSGNDRAGGYKGGEGSSRGRSLRYGRLEPAVKSDRWVFTRTPNFFSRTFSGHSPKGGEAEAPTSSKPAAQSFLPYLRNSFDCLGGKPEAAEQSSPPLIQSPAPGPPPALP